MTAYIQFGANGPELVIPVSQPVPAEQQQAVQDLRLAQEQQVPNVQVNFEDNSYRAPQ